jgi:hypothetical protein
MKAKSSPLLGWASGGDVPSVPSVDSGSELEWSWPVLRGSRAPPCVSPEVTSVAEDGEDGRRLGGCFHGNAALSGDGDSGARLQGEEEREK